MAVIAAKLRRRCGADIRRIAASSKWSVAARSALTDVVLAWFIIRLLYRFEFAMILLFLQCSQFLFNLLELFLGLLVAQLSLPPQAPVRTHVAGQPQSSARDLVLQLILQLQRA